MIGRVYETVLYAEVEQVVDWDGRGRSLCLRDPAGNSVELVDGDIWPP